MRPHSEQPEVEGEGQKLVSSSVEGGYLCRCCGMTITGEGLYKGIAEASGKTIEEVAALSGKEFFKLTKELNDARYEKEERDYVANKAAYQNVKEELTLTLRGKWVLLEDGEVAEVLDKYAEARDLALEKYRDRRPFIRRVGIWDHY